ncbi:MAG: VOC family protein [Solirubrobacteraceae bacterium]
MSRHDSTRAQPAVIDHIGFEVSDLRRSARFYDAIFFALGARRMIESEQALAYGINGPVVWFVVRGLAPAGGYGHIALQATGKAAVDAAYAAGLANGGTDDGPPGRRPQYGSRCYAGYLLDPDRLRVEIVSRR